jgi:hypothetical protein
MATQQPAPRLPFPDPDRIRRAHLVTACINATIPAALVTAPDHYPGIVVYGTIPSPKILRPGLGRGARDRLAAITAIPSLKVRTALATWEAAAGDCVEPREADRQQGRYHTDTEIGRPMLALPPCSGYRRRTIRVKATSVAARTPCFLMMRPCVNEV